MLPGLVLPCGLRRLAIGSGNPFSYLERNRRNPTMPKFRTLSAFALIFLAAALVRSQDPVNPPGFAVPGQAGKPVPARTAPEVVI